jgi:hypothetical protein
MPTQIYHHSELLRLLAEQDRPVIVYCNDYQ